MWTLNLEQIRQEKFRPIRVRCSTSVPNKLYIAFEISHARHEPLKADIRAKETKVDHGVCIMIVADAGLCILRSEVKSPLLNRDKSLVHGPSFLTFFIVALAGIPTVKSWYKRPYFLKVNDRIKQHEIG